jgi:uncharacterized membrane protein
MPMDPNPWLLFTHILGAVVWVGGGLMLSVIGLRARRSGNVGIIRDFAQTLAYVGLRLFMPAVLVLGVTGVWMVLAGDGNFGQLWVLFAVGGFALALAIGVGYLSGVAVELERVASEANASLAVVGDLLGRWMAGWGIVLLVLAFTVWDMVFKPGQ